MHADQRSYVLLSKFVCLLVSGTHEKETLEAGILEKVIDLVVLMADKDEDNVAVNICRVLYHTVIEPESNLKRKAILFYIIIVCAIGCNFSRFKLLKFIDFSFR